MRKSCVYSASIKKLSHMSVEMTKMAASMELCIAVVLSKLSVSVAVVVVRSVISVDFSLKFLHFSAYPLSFVHAFREVLT